MKRKIVCLFLCAVLFCIPLTAHAALPETETPLQPQWDTTATCNALLTIDSSKNASCKTNICGDATYTDKIEITMNLQKKVLGIWANQETWTTTVESFETLFVKTTTVSSGTYRVKSECEVYSGTLCDEITVYSSQVTV